MKLHELQSTDGSRFEHYRKGRGLGSGNGKTAGKGHKGQNARSGGGVALGFEGGQLPLWRALPKRGFKNVNHVNYATINVSALERFEDGTVVTPAFVIAASADLEKALAWTVNFLFNSPPPKTFNPSYSCFNKPTSFNNAGVTTVPSSNLSNAETLMVA